MDMLMSAREHVARLCVCVCMCVCTRTLTHTVMCVCVYVCVCQFVWSRVHAVQARTLDNVSVCLGETG